MRKLFLAIRHEDLQQVKDIISKNPDLIHCTAKLPPKKDDGQSPLQVALKTGNFDIADYLLDMGADPNFMEAEDCYYSEWRAPALHEAIEAAVMESRWSVQQKWPGKP
ncbi:MAG: ankyrin repeat domain-containing protein, partial [Spirochaetales bacterium]|nr:ankyrin repeat domain-containing protein [Spirochaetales bacterium]